MHTRTGIKKIEEVRENEEVLCFDETQKTTTFARVALAFSLTANYLTKVIVGKDTLTTTPNHPFYVPTEVSEADGSHWLQAGSLKKGALILLASGIMASVDTAYTYAATEKVYNFEIAEHHNYYVGESGILVHNGDCIVEFAKRVLAYEHGLNTAQVTALINDVLTFPNGKTILHRIGKGEIHPKAYNVVKKHAPTKVGDEDILASITARAKKDNDLKLYDDLDNADLFEAYLQMRNNPKDTWDIYNHLKEMFGNKTPPQNVPTSLLNYAQSKHFRNNGELGRAFQDAMKVPIRNSNALKLKIIAELKAQGKVPNEFTIPDLDKYDVMEGIRLETTFDNKKVYSDIDFALVKKVEGVDNQWDVFIVDAKLSNTAPPTPHQSALLGELYGGKSKGYTTTHNNSSFPNMTKGATVNIKAAVRINGPLGSETVTKFIND